MLEGIVNSILDKLREKLADRLVDHAQRVRNYKSIFESMQDNMISLSDEAADVEEETKNVELLGNKKRKREIEHWLKRVKRIQSEFCTLENEMQTAGFVRKFFGGGRAAILDAKIHELLEQSRHFDELVFHAYDATGETLLARGLVGTEFEKNLEKIWKLLVIDKVSSIGIFGIGGVGKTALAKHINNRLLKQNQENVFWITVSNEYNILMLQDIIARAIGLDLSQEYDEDKRASRLNRVLSHRQDLVLIFDDVWRNMDLEKLGDPGSMDGCRLMITTRSQEVCRRIGCREIIEVKTLKENEAWDLFQKTLGQDASLTPDVKEIAESMVGLCGGLPLGIITLAGTMRGETEIHVWSDAFAELRESIMGQQDMKEKVFEVLKYSFDRLEPKQGNDNGYSKLQLCFLYCALYPKDYEINRDELIRKFILEEFLDKRRSRKELFAQGHAILDKLASVCLLERVEIFSMHQEMRFVKMHDLVRAVALNIIQGKSVVLAEHLSCSNGILDVQEWAKDIEKMSLMCTGITEIPTGISPECPKLSTLLLNSTPLEFIPDSFFMRLYGLCILDLSYTKIKELPNTLSGMVKLKALLLVGCEHLVYVPNVEKLKELRELDLTRTQIEDLPRGMEDLTQLKFLSLHKVHNLKMLPRGLLVKFKYIQCLHLPCNILSPVEEIEELKHVEEFSGCVAGACDLNRLIKSKQSLAYHIEVQSAGCSHHYFDEPKGVKRLVFSEYNFNKVEDKDATIFAQDIQHLGLYGCEGLSKCLLEDFPKLNNPTYLESLAVHACEGIECILRTRQQFIMATSQVAIFSSLTHLTISCCHRIKSLGLPASQLPNLEEITILYCDGIQEIMEVAEDDGRGESGEVPMVVLPKLKHLCLRELPSLRSICNAKMACSYIETMELRGCRELNKLPMVFGEVSYESPPSVLREIKLKEDDIEWWETLELGSPTHHVLLQPYLRFL